MVETKQDTPGETPSNVIQIMQTLGQDIVKLTQLLKDVQKTQNGANKRVKAPKDKNKPKQPLSSFLLYSMTHRARVQEESPKLTITEVARAMGKEWNNLSEKEKQTYKKYADIDKERYRREIEQYNAGLFNPTTPSTEEEEKQEKKDEKIQEQEPKRKKQRTEMKGQQVQEEEDEKKNEKDKKKKQKVLKEQHQNKQKTATLSPSPSSTAATTSLSGSKSSSSSDSIKKPTFTLDHSKKNQHQNKQKIATSTSSSSSSTIITTPTTSTGTGTTAPNGSNDSVKKNNFSATPVEKSKKDKHVATSSDDSKINQPTTTETLGQSKQLNKAARRKLKKLKRKQRQQQFKVTDQQ